MNIINTLLILFIILIIINNLTNKNILNTITSYINYLKNIIYNKKDNSELVKSESFDTILNKIIVKTNRPTNNLQMVIASKNMIIILEKKLLKALNNHFNKYNYKFYNLIITDNIEYATTIDGKYFKPFHFSVKVYYKNKKIDTLYFKTELFVNKDTNMIVVLNISKEQYNIITDILTENNDNQPHFNYPNESIEPDISTYSTFNSMFIQHDKPLEPNHDNNSSLIPNINEINITDNSIATESYYTTSSA